MAPLSDVVAGNVAFASDVQQFKNLLTGAMTDQLVTLAGGLTVSSVANLPRMSTGTNVLLVRPNVEYAYNSGNITGTMKITLPVGWTGTMMNVTVDGETLDFNGPWQIRVGAFNDTNGPGWWYYRADIVGKPATTQVRLGYDSTAGKCCILLGNTSTVWSRPQVRVTQALLGFSGLTNDWTTGWSISVITSETGITNILTPSVDAAVSCRQGAVRIEAKNGSVTFTPSGSSGGGTINVTWDNAFSSALYCATRWWPSVSANVIQAVSASSLSATGASISLGNYCNQTLQTTDYCDFIAIGT